MRPNIDDVIALVSPVTREFEGLRLRAYICPAGKLTIGYGHTRTVKPGQVITKAYAETLLRLDLQDAAEAVFRLVKVPLKVGEAAALVDFVFNLGAENLRVSTLLRRLNAGDRESVPAQLRRWNKARVDGQMVVLEGLVRRREANVNLWRNPK